MSRVRRAVGVGILAVATVICGAVTAPIAAADPSIYIDEGVGEIPNAVAVANDGTIAAALFDAQAIALVRGPFDVVRVPIRCSPYDVAISPDGARAWAVCGDDAHVLVIDIASATASSANIGLRDARAIAYVAAADRLVIADMGGQVVMTSANPSYEVLARVSTPTYRPSTIAVVPDASRAYSSTDSGQLLVVDLRARKVKQLTGQGPEAFIEGVTLSATGTRLYSGATMGPVGGTRTQSILRLDPLTGRILDELPLVLTSPGGARVSLAGGNRSLSIGVSLDVMVDGQATSAFDVAFDESGDFGALTPLTPFPVFVNSLGRSADGGRVAIATTQERVLGTYVDGDQPLPPAITLRGTLTRTKLALSGSTAGLPVGTSLTVLVRDATRSGSTFVQQPVMATVGPAGDFRWAGKPVSRKVQVFVTGPLSASNRVTLSAR